VVMANELVLWHHVRCVMEVRALGQSGVWQHEFGYLTTRPVPSQPTITRLP
jgi:hypothetical protein